MPEPSPRALSVVAFTGGRDVPSARFRVRAYVAALAAEGVDLVERPSRAGSYPPAARALRPLWAAANVLERTLDVARSRRFDVTLLQRELLSTFVTLEPFTKRPRVLDVDDAIWLLRGGAFARRLAGLADLVLAGNAFLAERFSAWNRDVRVLPTAVDTDRFTPAAEAPEPERPVIGWSGTSSTLPLLERLEAPLAAVLARHPRARLRVVCDRPPTLPKLPRDRVEWVAWSEAIEVDALRDLAVGLMPLDDTDAARGKCAFKMLTYLACGVPAVVSPVGVNAELLAAGSVGYAARTDGDWADALDGLLREPDRAQALGAAGRRLVEERFSVRALAPRLAGFLREAAGESTGAPSERARR